MVNPVFSNYAKKINFNSKKGLIVITNSFRINCFIKFILVNKLFLNVACDPRKKTFYLKKKVTLSSFIDFVDCMVLFILINSDKNSFVSNMVAEKTFFILN